MARRVNHLLCNGADFVVPRNAKSLRLDYRADKKPNVRIELPSFVEQLLHVLPRLLDLLEIAAYVYCADRWSSRGGKSAVEYHAGVANLFSISKFAISSFGHKLTSDRS